MNCVCIVSLQNLIIVSIKFCYRPLCYIVIVFEVSIFNLDKTEP